MTECRKRESGIDNMKKIFVYARRIFYGLCCIFLALTLIFTVYVIISSAKGNVAHVFGKSIMLVTTGSMEPSIHEGDYILIEKTSPEYLDKGDIITFISEDNAIYGLINTHRILEKTDDGGFITKGDANTVPDPSKVYPEKIIGVFVRKIRFLRWINSFKSAKKLVLFLVFSAALAMSFYEIRTIGKIAKDSSENRKKRIDAEKEKMIREAIDKEKKKLYEENFSIQTENNKGDEDK